MLWLRPLQKRDYAIMQNPAFFRFFRVGAEFSRFPRFFNIFAFFEKKSRLNFRFFFVKFATIFTKKTENLKNAIFFQKTRKYWKNENAKIPHQREKNQKTRDFA